MRYLGASHIAKAFTVLTTVSLIALALYPAGVFALTAEELKAAIDAKNAELEKVNAQIEKTQTTLNATAAFATTLTKQIGTIDKNINQVTLNIKSSELTIDKLALQIASLEDGLEAQERDLEAKRASMSATMRQLQEKDNENLLMIFLQSGSLAEGLAKSQGILDLNDGLLVAISDIERLKGEITQKLGEVNEKKGSKEKESETLKAKKAIIEDQKAERSALLKSTKNQESTYQKQLAELQAQQEEIAKEVDDIEAKLRGDFDQSLIPTPGKGELGYPLATLKMTQGYGNVPGACKLYKSCFHNGVDYGAPLGTPILAAEDGEVIAASVATSKLQYGYYVLIKHNNNLTTLYGHMSKIATVKGAQVKRGQVIGYVGKTGYAFGPHLHFMVYQSATVKLQVVGAAGLVPIGVTLNPLGYL